MTSEAARPNRRYLKASLAGGAAGLVTVLLFLLEQRPELAQLLLERVVIAWGPQFVIVLLLFAFLYLLADRYAPQLIAAQSETALALQSLARAVEQLVARDDAFQREQDVLLNHVARRVDALHQLLVAHLPRAKSRGHRRLNGHLVRLAEANGKSKPPRRGPAASRRARGRRSSVSSGHPRRPRRAVAPPQRPRRAPAAPAVASAAPAEAPRGA